MDLPLLEKEIRFKTSLSKGKGGQHVNKVSTKVELIFDVHSSQALTDEEKDLIIKQAGSSLKSDGCLHIVSMNRRSQLANKKQAYQKLLELLDKCLKPKAERIPTEIPEEEKQKRLFEKKLKAEKKQNRKKVL